GHPQCEVNFVSEGKRSAPQARHWYIPTAVSVLYSPVNGRSVAPWRSTAYSSGLSTSCQRISSPSAFVRPASAGVAAFMFCVIVTSGVRRCLSGLRCEPTRGVHHPTDVRSCGSASAGDIGRVCAPSERTTAFGSCTFLRQQ